MASVIPPTCANWTPGALCKNEGTYTCGDCMLVLYCGRDCQRAHWQEHKKTCKSPLSRATWLPEWVREHRNPAWVSDIASLNLHNLFGSGKHLWGNTPAIDILQLEKNEGLACMNDIALLFAASEDLRNVVKTVANLPTNFSHRVEVTINDREFDVVARTAILLLFALTSLGEARSTHTTPLPDTAQSLIHIWYSAFLPTGLVSSLQSKIKPLLNDICSQAARKASGTILERTWGFSNGSTLRLALRKEEWLRMEKFVDVPEGLNLESAKLTRAAVTLAPERKDYRHRWYYKDATPSMRLSKQRFREDGLLLPYGHPRSGFDTPNPTFFQSPNTWPFNDRSDPLTSWPISEVHQTSWKAKHDSYGKLFAYLSDQLTTFLDRLATIKISFQLHNVNVRELPGHLPQNKYARIEVSNIADLAYVGTRETLALFSPLLQNPQQNPHATLITAYLSAVIEAIKCSPEEDQIPNMHLLTDYLTECMEMWVLLRHRGAFYKLWDSLLLAMDADKYFEKYTVNQRFQEAERNTGLVMKHDNTIVEPWLTRLKLRPGQVGAQEEFDLLLASHLSGTERYVEWKKARNT